MGVAYTLSELVLQLTLIFLIYIILFVYLQGFQLSSNDNDEYLKNEKNKEKLTYAVIGIILLIEIYSQSVYHHSIINFINHFNKGNRWHDFKV